MAELYINASTGSEAAAGTASAPLKTAWAALLKVSASDTSLIFTDSSPASYPLDPPNGWAAYVSGGGTLQGFDLSRGGTLSRVHITGNGNQTFTSTCPDKWCALKPATESRLLRFTIDCRAGGGTVIPIGRCYRASDATTRQASFTDVLVIGCDLYGNSDVVVMGSGIYGATDTQDAAADITLIHCRLSSYWDATNIMGAGSDHITLVGCAVTCTGNAEATADFSIRGIEIEGTGTVDVLGCSVSVVCASDFGYYAVGVSATRGTVRVWASTFQITGSADSELYAVETGNSAATVELHGAVFAFTLNSAVLGGSTGKPINNVVNSTIHYSQLTTGFALDAGHVANLAGMTSAAVLSPNTVAAPAAAEMSNTTNLTGTLQPSNKLGEGGYQ